MPATFCCTRLSGSRHDNGMRTLAAHLVRRIPTQSSLRTDGDLLAGFLTFNAEDDFAELVRRHGPLVWGVCRRALPDPADAEDAFQATFLVLVRRGGKLTSYPTIGPWLHKVAAWTARNVRRRNACRLSKQSALPEHLPAASIDLDLRLDIDAALLALPEKFRSPIVLCHLLGYSRTEAAQRLGCAEGTLSAWLARGLAKLRVKLGDVDPVKPLGISALAVPAVLTSSVVRAAVASRVAFATAAISLSVSHMVGGVMRMFWIKKASALSAAVFAMFAFGVGVGMTGKQVEGVAGGQEKVSATSPTTGDPIAITDLDKEIAELQKKIEVAETVHLHAMEGAELVTKKIKLVESKKETPLTQLLDDLVTLSRYQENAAQAADELKVLKDKLVKLKALKAVKQKERKPQPKNGQRDQPRIDQLQKLKDEYDAMRREMELKAEKFRKEIAALQAEMRNLDNSRRGHLELSITGQAGEFHFALKEIDAGDKEVGTLLVSDSTQKAKMLAILLARTKADPLAPKELRVVAAPSTALGGGPTMALLACDAAGYAKVKFTGYVFGGGLAIPLKADQKGEALGYRHYDNAERSPANLIKEIEEGMGTF